MVRGDGALSQGSGGRIGLGCRNGMRGFVIGGQEEPAGETRQRRLVSLADSIHPRDDIVVVPFLPDVDGQVAVVAVEVLVNVERYGRVAPELALRQGAGVYDDRSEAGVPAEVAEDLRRVFNPDRESIQYRAERSDGWVLAPGGAIFRLWDHDRLPAARATG